MGNKIKFALYLDGWSYNNGEKDALRKKSQKVLVTEYSVKMKGHIFCPECTANLFRSPETKEFSTNGRTAYFAHCRGIDTDCGLRTKRAEGKKYLTEEDATKALQDKELVIVEGFIKDRPIPPSGNINEYDSTQIEEQDGRLSNIPISRHRGETFNLPSKFKTIRGICNKFDENVYRYFFMPNGQHAIQLKDLLKNIETVAGEDTTPHIYYGRIVSSRNAGKTPKNIRMTRVKFRTRDYPDFYLKLSDEDQKEKGISDDSAGRVVLMYGAINSNGAGLCIEKLGWGEFALLPKKYEGIIYENT